MTRKRRSVKQRARSSFRLSEFDLDDVLSIMIGWSPPPEGRSDKLGTIEDVKVAWFEHREEFLPGDGTYNCYPGTRPWAWWKFEAPEQRRVLRREPLFENPVRTAKDGDPVMVYRDVLEPEAEALERMGLLTEWERKAVEAQKKRHQEEMTA